MIRSANGLCYCSKPQKAIYNNNIDHGDGDVDDDFDDDDDCDDNNSKDDYDDKDDVDDDDADDK